MSNMSKIPLTLKNLLKDIIPTFIPMLFFLELFIEIHLRFILMIGIIYLFFGYQFQRIVLYYLFNKNPIKLNLIQILAFSMLGGFILDILFGITCMYTNIFDFAFYVVFFEIIGIIFSIHNYFIRKKGGYNENINENYKDFIRLIVIFIPTFIIILFTYLKTPYPFMNAWDLLKYQGDTHLILTNNINFIYGDLDPYHHQLAYPTGFLLFLLTKFIANNIHYYQLIEFDKMGIFFTNFLSALWIYLICLLFFKSKILSTLSAFFIQFFKSNAALGPDILVPSSFSWAIGLALIYMAFIFFKTEKGKKREFNVKIFFIVFFIITALSFIFHFYTSVLISINLIFIAILYRKKIGKYLIIIIPLEIFTMIFLRAMEIPFITSFFKILLASDSYLTTKIELTTYLSNFSHIVLYASIFISIYYICIGYYKEHQNKNIIYEKKKLGIIQLIFFLSILQPVPEVYRINYLAVVYSLIIFSIFINDFTTILSKTKNVLINKSSNKIEIVLTLRISKRKTKIVKTISVIALFLFTIGLNYSFINRDYSIHNNIQQVERNSTYSIYEFWAAKYLYNYYNSSSYVILSDYGTVVVFNSLIGCSYYLAVPQSDNSVERYIKSIFFNVSESGLNLTLLYQFIVYLNTKYHLQGDLLSKKLILVFTTRTFQWFTELNTTQYKHSSPYYINSTFLNYIGNTPNIEKIYDNPQVNLFEVEKWS